MTLGPAFPERPTNIINRFGNEFEKLVLLTLMRPYGPEFESELEKTFGDPGNATVPEANLLLAIPESASPGAFARVESTCAIAASATQTPRKQLSFRGGFCDEESHPWLETDEILRAVDAQNDNAFVGRLGHHNRLTPLAFK